MESSEDVALGALLAELRAELDAADVANPNVDSELIVAHVLDVTRGRLQSLLVMEQVISKDHAARARALTAERANRVPLQHLTGRAAFRNIELSVGPGVFVPRPETELAAQFAIDALAAAADHHPIALDLCTGSGAIALSIADEVPLARVFAIEKSPEAHAWAERNVAEHRDGAGGGAGDRVTLLLGDAADAVSLLPREVVGQVHVLVSNPPYVPDGMIPRDPEVRDHDPHLALFGGADGLDLVRVISRVGLTLVAASGVIVLEHAEGQGAEIRALLLADGWRDAATHQDLTDRDRVTVAVR